MNYRSRVLWLILIMIVVVVSVVGMTLRLLYTTALDNQRARLIETAQSWARLIEAVGRFDLEYSNNYPGGAFQATLTQIIDSHENFGGFGKTGEFTLARLEDDQMVFLLKHRHRDTSAPVPVLMSSELAEPMRCALSGKSGTLIGLDYRGVTVLAAYEPVIVPEWNMTLGIVAKIDLAEIRAPFLRAGAVAGVGALLLVSLGTILFVRISTPILRQLEESEQQYRAVVETISYGIVEIDTAYTITFVNSTYARWIGYTPEALVGTQFVEKVIHPDEQQRVHNDLQETFKAKLPPTPYYGEHQTANGKGFAVQVEWHCQYSDSGVMTGLIGVVTDTTERRNTESMLARQNKLLQMLHEGTREINAELEVNTLLHHILDRAVSLLRADRGGGVYLYDAGLDVLSLEEGTGLNDKDRGIALKPGEGISGRVYQTGQPLIVNDYANWKDRFGITAVDPPSAVMGVPLHNMQGRVIGVLLFIADSSHRTFESEDIQLAEMFAAQAAIAYCNAHLYTAANQELAERKQVERALRESELRYRSLFKHTNDAIFILDLDENSTILAANQQAAQMLGYTLEEIIGHPVARFIALDESADAQARRDALLRGEMLPVYERTGLRKDGTTFISEVSTALAYDADGNPSHIHSAVRDISERKRIEIELRESEEKYRLLFSNELDAICILDMETGQVVDANEACLNLYGYGREALSNMLVFDVSAEPHATHEVLEQARKTKEARIPLRWHKKKDGTVFPVEIQVGVFMLKGREVACAVIRDITERREYETRLAEQYTLMQTILENIPDYIYVKDRKHRFVISNSTHLRSMGCSTLAEIQGKTDLDIFPIDMAKQFYEDEQELFRTEKPMLNREELSFDVNGKLMWGLTTKVPLRNHVGEMAGLVGITRNITDRKRTEQMLQESEAQYRSLFEDSPISLWEEDFSAIKRYLDDLRASGETDLRAYFDSHPEALTYCATLVEVRNINRATLNLLKASSKEEILGKLGTTFVDESQHILKEELLVLAEGHTHFEGEIVSRTFSGELIDCMLSATLAPGHTEDWGKVFVSILDITESKKSAQQQMALALERERVNILSRFVTHASHEFRTPLSTISTSAYLLNRHATDDNQKRHVEKIETQVRGLTHLLEDLLTITQLDSKTRHATWMAVNLNDVVQVATGTLQSALEQQNIRLDITLSDNLPVVWGDFHYLREAMQRIMNNAVRHTPVGGAITVRVEQQDADIRVTIADTGIGMDAKTLSRVFERFYRADTSGKTRGFGLGLPIARAAVELHGGAIEVTSEPGQGSTFTIILPIYQHDRRQNNTGDAV